ncbi:putative MFS family arabinose efflux permease [Motilibacter peucedani]|uniref:Putative MFS family arabinose efflux permease n=1 Tax=Motilibacter peucedani TaxID=598650 RepID=A0A420XNV8_9ACTN|nr:MFS transporter [Motilibacter peucedani]RKS73893.1 putative MFS family arabinose efflux permease [Motilibacter peucedani]
MPEDLLLADRDFRLLLLGQTTSQLGTQVSGVAVPLLAVLVLDASPFELGLVSASATVSFALVGLPAGAWLDRVRRRPVLVACDLVRAVLLASIPVAAAAGVLGIGQLVVVSLLVGFARVFFDVGYQSYLPGLVGRDRVLAGNSALEAVRATGQVAGPGLGGWLVGVLGAADVVAVQAATFAVSAVSLLAIRAQEAPPPARVARTRLRAEVEEGLRFVLGSRVLRALALCSALGNFSFAVASAVTVVFMAHTLGLSPAAIGAVMAAGSVAVMVGAACIPSLGRWFGSARLTWLSVAVSAPLTLLGPFAWDSGAASIALLVVSAAAGEAGQIVYAVTSVSLRQRLVPEHLLSRVSATSRFLIMGLFPLGALLGGVLGSLVGARTTLWVAAGLMCLSCLPVAAVVGRAREVDELS